MEEHGQVFGAPNMMAEIAARGPITCTIACPETLENYTGGIYKDETGASFSLSLRLHHPSR